VEEEVDETDEDSSVGEGEDEEMLDDGGLDTSCPLAAKYLYLFTHV
jgi:hypothetical protein